MSPGVFDLGSPAAVFAAVAASAAMKYVAGALMIHPSKYRYVGRVGEIWVFPIKSMRGIQVREAKVEQVGLEYNGLRDRHWLIIKENGKCQSQREVPKLSLIEPSFEMNEIELKAPGMKAIRFPSQPVLDRAWVRKVTVFGDKLDALDMGDEIGEWLSRFLGVEGLRLCFSESSLGKRDSVNEIKKWDTYAKKGDLCAFSNFCSYMVLAQESVNFLNTKLSNPVPLSNFRPNIVVHDCQPFDEDTWSSIRIGDCQLRGLDPTARCSMTTVDQVTGTKDVQGEPLATLNKIRKFKPYNSGVFGCNFATDKCGTIRAGDPIYAIFRQTPLYSL